MSDQKDILCRTAWDTTVEGFNRKVAVMLKDGWECFGEASLEPEEDGYPAFWRQTMVKDDN